ncbi:hypothetical protein KIH31_15395 [Paenarthrobacter sp. DKR-5]|uniref:hypothetical protein n=1 Tax=Paenarthrobacter sp. DKR-5 TaxID=2835535 RepID=UPI001BDD6A14|nr:hypothetical protein [Paenarthrobacter sp. DKR-5]MBT1003973.1 hypothetical protein [Paenarthrobacter sp. DKR-5]
MKPTLTALAAILLCTGCASAATTRPASPSSTSSVSSPASLSAGGRPQAPGGTVPASIGIAWDEQSRKDAATVASRAMADYARPGSDRTRWANDFARWLTPRATADYSTVDPANIPVSKVTGPATLRVDETNGYGVTAMVPTNAGTYTLQLLRTGRDAPWKVNRLAPPSS